MSWLTFSYINCQDVRNFCSADGSLHTSPRSNTAFRSKSMNAIVVGLVPRMSTWSLEVLSHEHIALLSGDATPKSYWVTSHEPQVKYRFSVEKYECNCGWTCATYVHLVFGSSVPWAHCAFEWGCDPEILLRRYESSYLLNSDQRGQQPLDKGAPVQCYLWDGAPIADTTLFESSFLIYEYNIIKSLMGRKLESRILAQRFPRKHFLVLCNDFPQKLESARFA